MSSFDELCEWIRNPALAEGDPQTGRKLAAAARQGLDEGDPRDDLLYDIEVELYEGKIPVDMLRDFERRYGDDAESLPYGNQLEIEFRRMANQMPEDEWLTTFYARAADAVKRFESGDKEPLIATLHEMHEIIVAAWEPYAKLSLTEDDVTAETVVGHRLLQDGVEGWLVGLDQLERASRGEGNFEGALSTCEQANRLMVAMQRLSERVEKSGNQFDAFAIDDE